MKFRSFLNLVAAIAAALLLLGTIGFVWVFAQSPLGLLKGTDQTPTAAMFVPKQAPLMASLVVNPDRLGTLRQVLAKPGDRARTRSEFEQFEQGILGNSELDYQRDVKPWLGNEITTAITTIDVDRDAENGKETGYLLALSTKDTQRSREFLQLFWQKRAIAGTELVFEPYKGTKIIYGKVATDSVPMTIASAVVGNQYVLFANSPKVLRDALNNVQAADLNLENSSAYQQAIAALDRGRIGLVYVNLPELAALNGQDTATASSAAISLGLDRSGIIADSAIIGGAETSAAKSPVDALKYIPAIAPISASGINLDRLWSGLSQGSGNPAKLVNQSIETLNKRWQIDLPKDIFSWVKGEYALGLVPRSTDFDWVFVADKSADPEAETAIAHLDEIAKSQGLSTGSIQVGDQPVSVWTRLESSVPQKDALAAEVAGAHTTIGKYEIFATSIEAMNTVLNAKKNVLASSKDFESAIAGLQKNNNGYLYIDWETAQPILESRLPVLKLIELAGQPLFERLRSITVSNYGNQSGIQRSGALIRLN